MRDWELAQNWVWMNLYIKPCPNVRTQASVNQALELGRQCLRVNAGGRIENDVDRETQVLPGEVLDA